VRHRLTEFDVIKDLDRLAVERPDLPEQRRHDLYEQVCQEDQPNPVYQSIGRFGGTLMSKAGATYVSADNLRLPLFDVREFEEILARIDELAIRPRRPGRPSLAEMEPEICRRYWAAKQRLLDEGTKQNNENLSKAIDRDPRTLRRWRAIARQHGHVLD
jgi:hypothetical protein